MAAFRAHEGKVIAAAISPDGCHVISGGSDSSIRLWNIEREEVIEAFEGHAGTVLSAAFFSDGQHFISKSNPKRFGW